MPDAVDAPSDTLPAQRTRARWWHPPQAAWTGRFVFAAAGFLLSLTSVVASVAAPLGRHHDTLDTTLQQVAFVLPWAVGLALVLLRVRFGKRWRWLSYFGGVFATFFVTSAILHWVSRQWI